MKKRLIKVAILLTLMTCALAMFGGWAPPKPWVNDVDLDKLMVKWKASTNWVLVEHSTTDGMYETGDYFLSNDVTVFERNGNIFKKTHSVKTSGHEEYQQMYVHEFDGDKCTTYFGRRYQGEKEWDSSPVSPNPGKCTLKIEDDFEKWILGNIEPNIRRVATSMREVGGVYHFWGVENQTKRFKEYGLKEFEGKPDLFQTFSYVLSFGTSTAEVPFLINKST